MQIHQAIWNKNFFSCTFLSQEKKEHYSRRKEFEKDNEKVMEHIYTTMYKICKQEPTEKNMQIEIKCQWQALWGD